MVELRAQSKGLRESLWRHMLPRSCEALWLAYQAPGTADRGPLVVVPEEYDHKTIVVQSGNIMSMRNPGTRPEELRSYASLTLGVVSPEERNDLLCKSKGLARDDERDRSKPLDVFFQRIAVPLRLRPVKPG